MSSEAQEEDELPEIKYIDSIEFQELNLERNDDVVVFRWIDALETEEEKWHKLLSQFVSTLAGRDGFCFRIIEKYAKVLHFQGSEVVQTKRGLRYITNASPREVGSTANLPLVLSGLSEVTRQVNFAQYVSFALAKIGQSKNTANISQKTIYSERLRSLYLFHQGYLQGLENLLANHRHLRNFRYTTRTRNNLLTNHVQYLFNDLDAFTLVPEANSLALQAVLEDWECSLQSEKIIQLVHANTLQTRCLHVKGDSHYFLNEALLCALAFNYKSTQEEMEDFDSLIKAKSTNARGKQLFEIWKMISKYDRNRLNANPQGFLVAARRLDDECKSEEIGASCTVMVETACKVWKQCEQHEETIKAITDTVARHPSLGPRMMKLAERCDVGHENEALLQQMCDLESGRSNDLHPSEPTWLDYVEKLVQNVGRFGSVRNTMEKSLKIMFEFLDFDSNRFNERAWFLLEQVLELSDPSFVLAEWKSRKDWWLKYQRSRTLDGRKMNTEATKTKKDVLKALEELVL